MKSSPPAEGHPVTDDQGKVNYRNRMVLRVARVVVPEEPSFSKANGREGRTRRSLGL